MAGWLEDTIQAILTCLLNMQQLNMSLVDRLAIEASWEGEPQEERDQLGRTRKEARAEYLPGLHQRQANLRERPGSLGKLRRPVP